MKALVLFALFLICGSVSAVAEDWPRWRGPRGDGSWKGPQLSEKWPKTGLPHIWKHKIGGGFAGVIVADGKVFVMDRQTEPDEVERVLCYSAETGKKLWRLAYPVDYGNLQYGNGPRAAPTVIGNRVLTLGTKGNLFCLDVITGKPVWSKDLLKDYKGRMPTWGYAAAPFVYRGTVIVFSGSENGASVLAFNLKTGKGIWRTLSDKAAYAVPVLIQHAGSQQLICWTPSHIRSLNPGNGTSNWSVPYKVTEGVSIATPIYREGIVFVSGYWEGSKAIQLGKKTEDAKLIWEDRLKLRGLMSQPLYHDGHGFLLDKAYGLTCFELKTGKKLWDDKHQMTPRGRDPQASMVWLNNEGRILALNSDGDLILAKLNRDGFFEQSRANIIGHTWAHPAYVGNRVIARSDTELICVELPTANLEK